MIDLMDKQVAKMDQCRMLVLDEADKLLSQDFKGMLDMVISRYVVTIFNCGVTSFISNSYFGLYDDFFGFPFTFHK